MRIYICFRHSRVCRVLAAVFGLLALASCSLVHAQLSAPIIPDEPRGNSVGVGLSAGAVRERDADFWGWTLEYGRRVSFRWVVGASIAWDRETETVSAKPDKTVQTYTLVGTLSYLISKRFSLTTGLGKGVASDDNPEGTTRFTSGDISTGVVAGFATDGFPFFVRDSMSFSVAYEYNLDQRETMLSFDVTFGWGF